MGNRTVLLKERGVVSFPKCGRTWIRLFLEYYRRFTGMGSRTVVIFRHDDSFEFKRRVLLVRHPCDVMVSHYIHKAVRRRWKSSVSHFIRNKHVGLPAFNDCYTRWSEREDDQLVVRYEDMFDTKVWADMLSFFDIPIRSAAFDQRAPGRDQGVSKRVEVPSSRARPL